VEKDPTAVRQRTYTLLDGRGRPYESTVKGIFGGHKLDRVYGRLDCPAARHALSRGGYTANRVFFADEATALEAGYRPCAACLPERYAHWRSAQDRRPSA
jgi:methylphosphotriester-DNA--protein-cysteine methyltransferase